MSATAAATEPEQEAEEGEGGLFQHDGPYLRQLLLRTLVRGDPSGTAPVMLAQTCRAWRDTVLAWADAAALALARSGASLRSTFSSSARRGARKEQQQEEAAALATIGPWPLLPAARCPLVSGAALLRLQHDRYASGSPSAFDTNLVRLGARKLGCYSPSLNGGKITLRPGILECMPEIKDHFCEGIVNGRRTLVRGRTSLPDALYYAKSDLEATRIVEDLPVPCIEFETPRPDLLHPEPAMVACRMAAKCGWINALDKIFRKCDRVHPMHVVPYAKDYQTLCSILIASGFGSHIHMVDRMLGTNQDGANPENVYGDYVATMIVDWCYRKDPHQKTPKCNFPSSTSNLKVVLAGCRTAQECLDRVNYSSLGPDIFGLLQPVAIEDNILAVKSILLWYEKTGYKFAVEAAASAVDRSASAEIYETLMQFLEKHAHIDSFLVEVNEYVFLDLPFVMALTKPRQSGIHVKLTAAYIIRVLRYDDKMLFYIINLGRDRLLDMFHTHEEYLEFVTAIKDIIEQKMILAADPVFDAASYLKLKQELLQ